MDADEDREVQWQNATGLTKGGDPSGIGPEELARYVQDAHRVEMAARDLVRSWPIDQVLMPAQTALVAALLDLDKNWPAE